MNSKGEIDMSSLPAIDQSFLTIFLVDLLNAPSPTGNAEPAIAFVEKTLRQFPELTLSRTRKGALVARWEEGKTAHRAP
jgi:putative aminopeptidase FrvX